MGKGIGCHADFSEFIFQDFSWVYGAHSVHSTTLSMIIDNFHAVWAVFPPLKADSPLLVDADALLSLPVSAQRLKAIAGKVHQILNGR